MRGLHYGAFVSWVIVAALAVGGFAAFSPRPAAQTSSTTTPAPVADGRGISTGRILASALASAVADRTFLTAATATATSEIRPDTTDSTVVPAAPSSTDAPSAPAPVTRTETESWPPGSDCQASWYGPGFAGKTTANGETFDPATFTAALHDVPFNTPVKVTRTDTGAVTTVRVNDRGPYEWNGGWRRHPTRCIDLSQAAMAALGGIEDGVIPVTISY